MNSRGPETTRMRRFGGSFVALAILALAPGLASANEPVETEAPIVRPVHRGLSAPGGAGHGAANSNCAGAACDTVWVGHSSAGPGGAFLGVGVGGVWDFDTGIAGTDSTQGWRYWAHIPAFFESSTRPATQRLEWARDYGNNINNGNQGLWDARTLAGRKFVRTGVVGAWHADGMAGVKRNVNDGSEPSATPISGARSAWCGLRESGNTNPDGLDALTGNYLNGDLVVNFGGIGLLPEFPGYCHQWDQMMYKDFSGSSGTGTVSFRVRCDMSDYIDPMIGGSGWLNPFPDPELVSNFVNHPADSFMVYVGSPTEVAYDPNRRFFSEILDLSLPHAELFAASGVYPQVAADTAITRGYAGLTPGTIRVVFRVKTNRVRADQSTGFVSQYNSKQGAALVDEVSVDGGLAEGFETTAQVKARTLISNLAAPGGPWATTGRPPHQYYHVENVLASGLAYGDLCGGIGTPTRICNLTGNVLLSGNHDDPNHVIPSRPTPATENFVIAESPAVDLAVRTAAPGTKNGQGIDQQTATRTKAVIQNDFFSGNMWLDESVFYRFGIRAHGPAFVQPVSGARCWSGYLFNQGLYVNPDPLCYIDTWAINGLGATIGSIDSLRVLVGTATVAWRFGGTNLGNTRGTYWDNVRFGFVRTTEPAVAGMIWHQFQDQFPWNEAVPPGDNASFDTTAALMNSGLNIAIYITEAVVAGDSLVYTATYAGNGVTTGTRLDLVFRIDPGPGNYAVKGNRTSALVDRDPAHPFFSTYQASNGPFGTPGGHGGTWNRHAWNSARMDSAEINLYPIVSRGIGNPVAPGWMTTLHEEDPNFATLGITKNVCFLIDPNGPDWDGSNITCSGAAPAVYGPVQATTKEGTKILPDGWFTPGTHIEYFVRRSNLEAPAVATLLFDTTRVFPQDPGGLNDRDQDRWHSVDVLPDMWKSTRYGGRGLACLLVVDGADRRGSEPAYLGALDTLCYGRSDGAKKGWKPATWNADPNDPAGFVAANLGQVGINYDLYEIRAAESAEAGHPGVRLANNLGVYAAKGDKSGPSAAMLGALYRTVLHFTGDLDGSTLHDGFDSQEGADDLTLYSNFLAGATLANRRGLWLSGDAILED